MLMCPGVVYLTPVVSGEKWSLSTELHGNGRLKVNGFTGQLMLLLQLGRGSDRELVPIDNYSRFGCSVAFEVLTNYHVSDVKH